MMVEFPGWLSARKAAEKYGIPYQSLRRLVADGVFTRGKFTLAKERPPIFLREDELDAWKSGGVDAVRRVRVTNEPPAADPHHDPDLGGEG